MFDIVVAICIVVIIGYAIFCVFSVGSFKKRVTKAEHYRRIMDSVEEESITLLEPNPYCEGCGEFNISLKRLNGEFRNLCWHCYFKETGDEQSG